MKALSGPAFALFAAAACAADNIDFERRDVDNNGWLSEMEWQQADFVTVPFHVADIDNNGASIGARRKPLRRSTKNRSKTNSRAPIQFLSSPAAESGSVFG